VKKLVFLGLGFLLLLGAVGAGLSVMLGGDKSETKAVKAEPPPPPPPSEQTVVDLAAVAVPLVREGRVRRYVTLVVKYDALARPGQKAALDDFKPQLRDAIIREVHGRHLAITADGFDLDMKDVEARFGAIGRRILGADTYRGVNVGEAQASAPGAPPPARPTPSKSSGH